MLKIAHRVNTIEKLRTVPEEYGVELDIRYEGNNLILHHEPFTDGELFEDYLKAYKHKFIILNVKSEGIEEEVLRLIKKYSIEDYFFLDVTIPFIVKYIKKGEKRIAIRFSEYEPIEFVQKFKGLVDWVWVDCFNTLPLDNDSYEVLKKNFKLCLVSPELEGHSTDRINEFKKILADKKIDAVCTKRPELW